MFRWNGLLLLSLSLSLGTVTTACAQSSSPSTQPGGAPQGEQGDLQKATQNPVADLISFPLQNNTDFNIGAFGREKNTLNIQPVIPLKLSEDWNMIVRWITPVVFQPDITQPHFGTVGLGDMNPSFSFRHRSPERLSGVLDRHSYCQPPPMTCWERENCRLAQRLLRCSSPAIGQSAL